MKFNTKDLWVWEFSDDGSVVQLIDKAKRAGCGVIIKVLDGVNYQATFDHHPDAIDSPMKAATIARRFEEAGVPCSFWVNPRGVQDVSYEARAILETDRAWRPRAWYLDTEPYEQFWEGTPDEARRLVQAIKGYSKANHADGLAATVIAAPDARPWAINDSMAAFCEEADAIAPQCYWRTFESNGSYYARYGFPPPPEGVTANFVLATAYRFFTDRFHKPVLPIFQGDSDAVETKQAQDVVHFVGGLGLSVWRAGVTNDDVIQQLAQFTPPGSTDEGTVVDPRVAALETALKVRAAAVVVASRLPDGTSIQDLQNILDFFRASK